MEEIPILDMKILNIIPDGVVLYCQERGKDEPATDSKLDTVSLNGFWNRLFKRKIRVTHMGETNMRYQITQKHLDKDYYFLKCKVDVPSLREKFKKHKLGI